MRDFKSKYPFCQGLFKIWQIHREKVLAEVRDVFMTYSPDYIEKIRQLRQDLLQDKIKSRDLEKIVFRSVFLEDPNHWIDTLSIAADIRRWKVEKKADMELPSIEAHFTSIGKLGRSGIELQVGGVAIPLGVTDPLNINGDHARGGFSLPLATNEAALIAGLNRGIRTINLAGGIRSIVCYDGMTRAPVLECPSIDFARNLKMKLQHKNNGLFQEI
ncbi:MAG: hypothetical protein ACFFE8_17145, partial [Candidatus Heimdallarchaeota archaeon]